MSRAAVSKSRADKGSKPPPAHTPVVAHEIVPGKFTDQDWYGNFCYVLSFSKHLTWIWNIMWFKTLLNCWYQYFANDNWVNSIYEIMSQYFLLFLCDDSILTCILQRSKEHATCLLPLFALSNLFATFCYVW